MKNSIKLIAITAIVVVIGFAMTGCGNPSGGGGGWGGSIGDTIILEDKDVTYHSSIPGGDLTAAKAKVDFDYICIDYDDDIFVKLSDYIPGATVKINNSKLSLELGVPKNEVLESPDFGAGVTVSDPSAKISNIPNGELFTADHTFHLSLIKTDTDTLLEGAMLIYATKNVNIKGTESYPGWTNVWNVSLKSGWNYILISDNDITEKSTITATTNLPSSYKWTVYKWWED